MTNLHDLAYALEKGIRSHPDFEELKKLHQEVNADESAKKLFESFREIQMKFQTMQMMGQEIPEEEMKTAELTISLAQQNPKIMKLMEAEQRFSLLINDVTKIVMSPLEELYQ